MFFSILISLICSSCKESGNKENHTHEHYYRIYKGDLEKDDPIRTSTDSLFTFGKFENQSIKIFTGSDLDSLLIGSGKADVKVYHFVKGRDSSRFGMDEIASDIVLLKKNDSISGHWESSINKDVNPSKRRGNLGCVPKFIFDASGRLFFRDCDGFKCIPLATAYHDKVNDQNVIDTLENYQFKITNDDFISLVNALGGNRNLEGGLDTLSNVAFLQVYLPGSTTAILRFREAN